MGGPSSRWRSLRYEHLRIDVASHPADEVQQDAAWAAHRIRVN